MGGHSDHGSHGKESISPEEIRKILSKAKTQTFSEAPKYVASENGGVMMMNLAGRFDKERQRLGPDFTEADRQYRIRFLADQNLHPAEPFEVPEYYKVRYNPIRRFYRFPLDKVEVKLRSYLSNDTAKHTRKLIGRIVIGYFVMLSGWYYLKYNTNDWERARTLRVHRSREPVYPGDPRYPMANPRQESWHHFDLKFHERKALLDTTK